MAVHKRHGKATVYSGPVKRSDALSRKEDTDCLVSVTGAQLDVSQKATRDAKGERQGSAKGKVPITP